MPGRGYANQIEGTRLFRLPSFRGSAVQGYGKEPKPLALAFNRSKGPIVPGTALGPGPLQSFCSRPIPSNMVAAGTVGQSELRCAAV